MNTNLLANKKTKIQRFLHDVKIYRGLLLMLIPALLFFIIFRYGPIMGVVIAFKDFKPKVGQSFYQSLFASDWVGLQYFKMFLTNKFALQAIRNTVIISVSKLIFGFPAPIILALLLNEIRSLRFKKTIQILSYLPHFVSWVILAGIIRFIFSPDIGIVLPIFKFLNLPVINLLGDKRFFVPLLVVTDIWQSAGWGSIIYIAALSNVDLSLYESAHMDGAGRFKQLIYITLPSIAPTIVVMLILRTGTIMNAGFDQVFNLYNPKVYAVADIIDTYVFRAGLEEFKFSLSTAIGLFQSVIGMILVLTTNFVAKKFGQEGIF